MTRADREQLIERYLRGQMSPAEEHDFFIEVAGNRELRVDLKAYRIVDEALAKDRSADTATYSSLRANMLRMIESPRAIPSQAPEVQSSRSGPVGTSGTAPARPATPAAGAGHWTIRIGIGVALAVVAGIFLLRQGDAPTHRAAIPAPLPVVVSHPGAGSNIPSADTLVTAPAAAAISSSPRVDSALHAQVQGAESSARQSVTRGSVRGVQPNARSRAARPAEPVRSIRGGVRTAKSDSLNIHLIIQDPKKK